MPLYEYRCGACEHEFEELIRAGAEEPESCPSCGQTQVERLISNTNFQLKGSGWYETDYARDDDRSDEQTDDGQSEGGETSTEGDADAHDADKAPDEAPASVESSDSTEATAAGA